MRKRRFLLIFTLIATFLSSCGNGIDSRKGYFVGPDAPTGAIKTIDGNQTLINKDCSISFVSDEVTGKYGVYIKNNKNETIAFNNKPVKITIRGAETFGQYQTFDLLSGYDGIEETNYGYYCVSIVNTTSGSRFRVMDSYYISRTNGIALNRKVTIIKANARDIGYESVFTLRNGFDESSTEKFDFFIPSILYKDTKYNAASALITNLYNSSKVYIKETRMGIPLTMISHKESGNYIALVHAEPKITVNGEVGGGGDGAADDDLEYGSLGFENELSGKSVPLSVSYCYPCAEGPSTFDSGSGWAKRFHEVATSHFHEYKLGIVIGNTSDFNDSLVDSYEKCFGYLKANCDKYSNEVCYQQNIDLLNAEYASYNAGGVQSYGVPWELNIDPSKVKRASSFQMGFVGQQTSVGAHLYRHGLAKAKEGDPIGDTYKSKGENILNFWTSDLIYPKNSSTMFPYIWFEGGSGGLHRSGEAPYAVIYLRMLADGVEGILDAYIYGNDYGAKNQSWLDYCVRFADNLLLKQQEGGDGSFPRAFTKEGGIPDSTYFNDKNIGYDPNDLAKFKINTPVAIRFLAKMYEVTGENKYKQAALWAADYSFENIYKTMGKYVGGTCDNANVVDKEAAIYAMFGFRAALSLDPTNENYKKAARHAACCALSWTFMYDFACPSGDANDQYSPYVDGNCMGLSVIATGHAGVDGFASYMWFDLYEIYELTGVETYKEAAIALQNATKQFTDYYGTKKWLYKAQMVEACQVSDFTYRQTTKDGSLWLPWCSVAQMNPIIYTLRKYGVYQIEEIGGERK